MSPASQRIAPAAAYVAAPDLAVVTCFFNPSRYQAKRRLFERFMEPIRAGNVPRLVVECVFDDAPFEFSPGLEFLQIRGGSTMFQKERLLNLAIERLPPHITKVAWLDADVLFDQADWPVRTSEALERLNVVQPFSVCHRLPRGHESYVGCGRRWESFGAVYQRDPSVVSSGDYQQHGHVGFAWAARRDVLEGIGLRDLDVGGDGDHLMAHAMVGDWNSSCVRFCTGPNGPYATNVRQWAQAFYARVQGKVGAVDGTLLHLWHGRVMDRRYYQQSSKLRAFGFDPARHLKLDPNGLWRWSDEVAGVGEAFARYFAERREDG
jgi:hypothetical protein